MLGKQYNHKPVLASKTLGDRDSLGEWNVLNTQMNLNSRSKPFKIWNVHGLKHAEMLCATQLEIVCVCQLEKSSSFCIISIWYISLGGSSEVWLKRDDTFKTT